MFKEIQLTDINKTKYIPEFNLQNQSAFECGCGSICGCESGAKEIGNFNNSSGNEPAVGNNAEKNCDCPPGCCS